MLIYSWTLRVLFCVMLSSLCCFDFVTPSDSKLWSYYSVWCILVPCCICVKKIIGFLNNLTLYMDWFIWNFWIQGFLFRIVYFVSLFMVCLCCRLFPRLWKCTSQMQLCFSVVLTLWPVIDLVALIFHWKVIA